VVEVDHDDTALCEDPCGSSLAHLGTSFLSAFSRASACFSRMLEAFLGNNEKKILAFPSLEFHVPSKERGGEGEVGNFKNGCAK